MPERPPPWITRASGSGGARPDRDFVRRARRRDTSDEDDIYHNLATPRSASIPSWARDDRSDIDRLRRQGLGSSLEQSIRMIAESQTQLIQSLRDGLLGRQDRSEYKQKLTSIVVEKWSGGKDQRLSNIELGRSVYKL